MQRQLRSLADDGIGDPKKSSGDSSSSAISTEQTKVVVLVNENSPTIPTLLFLRRRGYKIKIIHKLMDTISCLMTFKPDVFLLSWNLHKTDARKAHFLITSKFKVLCIVFGEENNTKTSNSLMRSGIPNTLLPPVSGPGMHMRIQSLLRNQRASQVTSDMKASGLLKSKVAGKGDRTVIRSTPEGYEANSHNYGSFKKGRTLPPGDESSLTDVPPTTMWNKVGGGSSDPKEQMWQGVANKGGKEKFYYFRGPEAPKFNSALQKWENTGEVQLIMTDEKADADLLTLLQNVSPSPDFSFKSGPINSGNIIGQSDPQSRSSGSDYLGSPSPNDNHKSKQSEQELLEKEFSEEMDEPDLGSLDISVGGLSEKELAAELQAAILGDDVPPELEEDEEESPEPEFHQPNEEKEKKSNSAQQKAAKEESLIDMPYVGQTQLSPNARKTLLAQGVQKAVATVCQPSTKNTKAVHNVSKCTVTIIKTTRYRGYLVGGNASDLPDHVLMKEVISNLTQTMRDLGEPLNPVTGTLELQLDPLPFMLWAQHKAEFYVKSKHGDDEIVFAYVPLDTLPEVIEEDSEQLMSIDIAFTWPDKPVHFDVYIYMPKNNKYLLYIKKGSVLSNKTIIKLTHFNVQKLYIRKTDEDLFYAYGAKYKVLDGAADLETPKKKAS